MSSFTADVSTDRNAPNQSLIVTRLGHFLRSAIDDVIGHEFKVIVKIETQTVWDSVIQDLEALGFKGSKIDQKQAEGFGHPTDAGHFYVAGDFRPAGTNSIKEPQIHPEIMSINFDSRVTWFESTTFDEGNGQGAQEPSPPVTTFPAKMELDKCVIQKLFFDLPDLLLKQKLWDWHDTIFPERDHGSLNTII